jgi:hypothetical protein
MTLIPPSVGVIPPEGRVEDNELASAYRKTVIDIQSQLFDKAAAYNNLIMVGGYAGAFTVWGNVRSQLPPYTNILIALLLGFSLSIFIFYQVYKMTAHVMHFQRVRVLLGDTLLLQEFFDRYNEMEQQARRTTLRTGVRLSLACLLLSGIPALLALGLLFFNFAALLIGFPVWPT